MRVPSCSVFSREMPLPAVLAGVAHALMSDVAPTPDTALGPGLTQLVAWVPGARWASITYRRDTNDIFTTPASTGGPAVQVDSFQYDLGAGPCVEATAGAPVTAGSGAFAARWPELAVRAFEETPVRAVLSYPLPGLEPLASVNFYGDEDDAFCAHRGDDALAAAAAVASTCAVGLAALITRVRADNLELALTSSRQIGAAVGIVMAQQRCTYDEALLLIRRASQHTHRKVRDLAEDIMLTGALPDGS